MTRFAHLPALTSALPFAGRVPGMRREGDRAWGCVARRRRMAPIGPGRIKCCACCCACCCIRRCACSPLLRLFPLLRLAPWGSVTTPLRPLCPTRRPRLGRQRRWAIGVSSSSSSLEPPSAAAAALSSAAAHRAPRHAGWAGAFSPARFANRAPASAAVWRRVSRLVRQPLCARAYRPTLSAMSALPAPPPPPSCPGAPRLRPLHLRGRRPGRAADSPPLQDPRPAHDCMVTYPYGEEERGRRRKEGGSVRGGQGPPRAGPGAPARRPLLVRPGATLRLCSGRREAATLAGRRLGEPRPGLVRSRRGTAKSVAGLQDRPGALFAVSGSKS